MRKSQVIPKICAFVLFLVMAIIISAPVSSVMLNKIFGGGTLDFNDISTEELKDNRPIEGKLYSIISCTGSDSDDSYYYLACLDGRSFKEDDPSKLIVIEALSTSDAYDTLNDLWRSTAKDGTESEYGVKFSGIIKSNTSAEDEAVEVIKEKVKLGDVEVVEYHIDCTKPVSSFVVRFVVSLLFYIAAIASALLVVQAVKKNRELDVIENERSIYRIAQEVKSGNSNPDGTDAMFGDSERDLENMPQRQGEAYELSYQEQQYQNSGYNTNSYTGSQNQSDDEYDGFFGG